MLSLPNVKRFPKHNSRQRSKTMVQKEPCILLFIRKFSVLLKALEILSLFRLCTSRSSYRHACASPMECAQLLLRVVRTLELVTEQSFSPKPRVSSKKNKSQWAEHGGDPEAPLFPLLDAAETDQGAPKSISKVACSFLCLLAKDFRQKRNFERPEPYSHVQIEEGVYNCKLQAYINLCTCISRFSLLRWCTSIPPLSQLLHQNKPQHKGQISHSLVNIWGDQKSCAQSFAQIKVLHSMFKFPVQALV